MPNDFIHTALQYGLAGIIFIGFIVVLRWVIESNNRILRDNSEERKTHLEILRGFSENIRENNISAKDFQTQVKADHAASTKEHAEMIAILGRINGYNK